LVSVFCFELIYEADLENQKSFQFFHFFDVFLMVLMVLMGGGFENWFDKVDTKICANPSNK
jgi:hypothetical protein